MKSHKKCCIISKEPRLKRALSLFQISMCGTGIILGAGIYTLIGVAAGITGNSIWLAFFISSIIAATTGLSYAELSSIYKKDDGEYEYAEKAFSKKIAMLVAIMILLTGIFSAATVALGFGGYLSRLLTSFSPLTLAIFSILFCSWINHRGIKESAILNTIFTIIEAIGLVIIIFLGIKHLGSVNYFEMPNGIYGLLKATALVFFAYMGFETIVKLSEETKNPAKNIPKGIIYSLIASTILYILVAISAVSILNWQKLGSSQAPLADVAASSLGNYAFVLLAVIALFSTANTVLMTVVTTSRLVYGMAERHAFPKIFSSVNRLHNTPTLAIVLIAIITILSVFIEHIQVVAYLNNLFLFPAFGMVNLSAIMLRWKKQVKKRPFTMPLNIGKMPIPALIGFLSCAVMIIFVILGLV